MHLSTPRLNLWPCTLDDIDRLLALWREPEVRKYLLDDRVLSRAEVEEYVASFRKSGEERGHYLWMVEAQSDGTLVGFAAIKQVPGTTEVELYYGLAPQFWGQGFASEAAQAVLDYGFGALRCDRIWARTDLPNEASKRVAKRLGMRPAEDPGETSFASFVIERPASA